MNPDNSFLPSPESVYEFLKAQGKPVKFEIINHALCKPKTKKKEFRKLLENLADQRLIQRLPQNAWCAPEFLDTLIGSFLMTRNGAKFIPQDGNSEMPVNASQTGGAWDKDLVKVIPYQSDGATHAKVIEILERTEPEAAARVVRRAGRAVICRSIARKNPVFFTLLQDTKSEKKLKQGQLVTVRPEKPLRDGNWLAALVNSYTKENALSLQEALVKLTHNVPDAFPALALEQAKNLPDEPLPEDYENREDMRNLPFVTIDGEDARDFDDAICVEKTENGWLLRVAIADVSHYVLPDKNPDSLDGEAFARANSWYFPKSVEPMLPKKLSNGLCSLKPDADRLAMVVEIGFTKDGVSINPRFSSAVIRSHARLTYDNAADFFSGNPEAAPAQTGPMLREAFELYKKLAMRRRKRGSLDFELPEPAYHFSEKGELENIACARRNDAHMLIEEFMIAANEAVAQWLSEKRTPLLYRVHPVPEAEKLLSLFETLKKTALEILPANISHEDFADPRVIQKILLAAKGTPHEYIVNRLCLRSMNQARYEPENVGHYALASPFYCHFTSPIRRYADLLAHRALKHALKLPYPQSAMDEAELNKIGEHLNKQERCAIECERDMGKRLACLLLGGREGEILAGTISGVTEFGIFVEFDDIPAEGLVKTSELGSDWFELDAGRQMLVGRSTGKIYQLGQPLKVKVIGINQDRMETRLALADAVEPRKKKSNLSEKPAGRPEKRKKAGSKRNQEIASKKSGHRKKPLANSRKRFHD